MKEEMLKPHEDYDFKNHEKVYCESDKGYEFYELYYEQEVAAWVLMPFTDETFEELIEEDENIQVSFLYEIGIDIIKKVEELELEEDE